MNHKNLTTCVCDFFLMSDLGNSCLAYDVCVNPAVIGDCEDDETGTFRNFLCELAIQYIDQKVWKSVL